MGYFEDLTKAFDVPLVAFGNANGIKVALENIDAPTSTDTPYLASYMLLADTEQADLFFTEQRSGIYQVDLTTHRRKVARQSIKWQTYLTRRLKQASHFHVTTSAPRFNRLAWGR